MRLPTYDEIARDDDQIEVYETPLDESVFAVGPPGSGKTVLAVHRAQMLADAGIPVALITYNRMLRRLISQLTEDEVRAQTMHKFVSDRYFAQTGGRAPLQDRYVYDWQRMFATLADRGVAPEPAHVVVDEGQDLPAPFFRYLRDYVATAVTVFADEDQAIDHERSAPRDIMAEGRLGHPVLLKANHRNTPEIASVAEHFHAGDAPVPEVQRRPSGTLPRAVAYNMDSATGLIANWYANRGGRVGVAVVRPPTAEVLHSRLSSELVGQRVQIYTSGRQNEDAIDLLEPGITILNVGSIKGQEFDTVFVMEIGRLLRDLSDVNRRRMYMLCARGSDSLFLMHEGDRLPDALLDRLPGPEFLERP